MMSLKIVGPRPPVSVTAFATQSTADDTIWCHVKRSNGSEASLAEAMRDAGFKAGDVVLVVKVGKMKTWKERKL